MDKIRQALADSAPSLDKGHPKSRLVPRLARSFPPAPNRPQNHGEGKKGGKKPNNKSSPGGSNILKRRLRGLVRGKA